MSDAAARTRVWLLPVAVGLVGTLVYCHVTGDPTPGLTYDSGDRPAEVPNHACVNDGGRCPPPGFAWTIAAGGAVRTRLRLDDTGRARLRGAMRLTAVRTGGPLLRDCPAVVDWTI